jgi:hypothetical protein
MVSFFVPPSVNGDLNSTSSSSSAAATYSEVTTGINPTYAALGLLTTGIIDRMCAEPGDTSHFGRAGAGKRYAASSDPRLQLLCTVFK